MGCETSRVVTIVGAGVLAMLLMWPAGAIAQDAAELAKQTQNPVASLVSFPLQGNWDMGIGTRDATATTVNIQPVIPISLSESTNVILRVIMPLTSQPGPEGLRFNGITDIVATAFFSPAKAGKIIWGVGPVALLPTATNSRIGTEKFGVGPSAVVMVQPGKWSTGMLYNQIWSVSGASDREDVDQALIQPFVNYNLGGGLAAGMAVEAQPNWRAPEDKWTVPVMFSLSKVTKLGNQAMNFAVAVGPVLSEQVSAPSWRFRLAGVFLFPK